MIAKLIAVFLLAFAAVGISFGQRNDISEAEYVQAEEHAAQLLKASNYRLTRNLEYFEVRGKSARLAESNIKEVLQPNKWRTVEMRDYAGKVTKEERIWDGKSLFVRVKDGEWLKYSGGSGFAGGLESGKVTKTYRFLGKTELNGVQTNLYELESLRVANKMSRTDVVVVRYNKKIRSWFSIDGKLVQKIEENTIEGREDLSRETTKVDYDPNIKIEAPIP